jgi:hypothetical protein
MNENTKNPFKKAKQESVKIIKSLYTFDSTRWCFPTSGVKATNRCSVCIVSGITRKGSV